MIIYLNGKEITEKYTSFNLPDILEDIKNNLKNEVLAEIQVNNVVVNEKYLEEDLFKKDEINNLNFITKKTETLIKETVDEASEYLPKLKKGIDDTVLHFRNGEEKKAHDKFQLIIDGIEWYTDAVIKITSLLDDQDLYDKAKSLIEEVNKPLSDLMIAYNKKDYVLIGDILEYEIIEKVNHLINFNKKIMNNY